jgi:hypothetical protein
MKSHERNSFDKFCDTAVSSSAADAIARFFVGWSWREWMFEQKFCAMPGEMRER